MSHVDVFAGLLSREVQSMMANSQLADYYTFLGLQGFKRLHEHRYRCASKRYRKLSRYYIGEFYTLPPSGETPALDLIPSAWDGISRTGVSSDARRKAVRECMALWCQWEADTHSLTEDAVSALSREGDIAAAGKVECLLRWQDKETARAYSLRCKLEATDYDMVHVMTVDRALHDKWKG